MTKTCGELFEGYEATILGYAAEPVRGLAYRSDCVEPGDLFYLHILNEDLAYEVDRILPMVDKDDYDALEEALKIEEGKDQVTLFTCTPYGVNSHRLLVRGHRVPYNGELDTAPTPAESMVQAIQNYYMLYLLLGVSVTALVIFLLWRIIGRKK